LKYAKIYVQVLMKGDRDGWSGRDRDECERVMKKVYG